MLNLCVTTFVRQDLLGAMLLSAFAGTVKPDAVYLVDQANRLDLLGKPLVHVPVKVTVVDLREKRGCEGSAINWYLRNVPEERVIAHEDVVFDTKSLELFVSTPGDFLVDDQLGVITYRDRCREAVGFYDVTISPNYFTYVDVDYEDRLALAGIHPTVVSCGIQHLRNGTRKGLSGEKALEFHRRVGVARANYEAKWGRPVTPGGHTIGRGAWRQAQR